MTQTHASRTNTPSTPNVPQHRTASTNTRDHTAEDALASPSVAIIMVTWNRSAMVRRAIESVLAQRGVDLGAVHLVVIDNASTDGTTNELDRWLTPERTIENTTAHAHEPSFASTSTHEANSAGLSSVTLVRNAANLGGTGGFNTGFQVVERFIATPRPVDFVWLLDDDAVADEHALAALVDAAAADQHTGIVGSRAVDIADRRTTYETTIYYDPARGRMADTPHEGHRLEADHRAWASAIGGTRGDRDFTGVREVDVASACSLLARWSVVERIGYWDSRYFIYCDDADWCLRVGRAGFRVVCALDAVVYHTPWFEKLTPTRRYYAERNAVWTMRKGLSGRALRRSTASWMHAILRESLAAGLRRRRFQAEILRRTAHDAAVNRPGKLDYAEPQREPLRDALRRLDLMQRNATIVLFCSTPEQRELAATVMDAIERDDADAPRFIFMTRKSEGQTTDANVMHRLAAQSDVWARRSFFARTPEACIVFDLTNDVPLLRCPITLHIDHRTPEQCQVERDGVISRVAFVGRWCITAARAAWYCIRMPRQRPEAPFG